MKIKLFSNKLIKTMKAIDEIFIARIFTYRQIDSLVDFLFFCIKIVIFERFLFISLYIVRNQIRNVNKSCKIIDAMRLNLQ